MNTNSFYCTILTLLLLYQVSIVVCYDYFRKSPNKAVDKINPKFSSGGPFSNPHYISLYEPQVYFISLNIFNTYSTNKVKYFRHCRNSIDKFVANPPYLFYKIRRGNRILWESEDGKYGYEVILRYNRTGNHDVRINFIEYDRVTGRIVPFVHSLVTLNIRHKYNTDIIRYKHRDGVHTFTTMKPYFFDKVINGNEVLWTPSEPLYPYKVLVIPVTQYNNILRIFFPTDTSILTEFPKTRRREPDTPEIVPRSMTKEIIKTHKRDAYNFLEDVKIFTEDSSEPNDTSKFVFYRIGEVDELYMFRFNEDVKCTEIKYEHKIYDPRISSEPISDDRTVWKHGYNDFFENPMSLYLHGFFKFMFIEFKNDLFYFYRKSTSDVTWKLVPLESVKSLDISKVKILTYQDSGRLKELSPSKYLVYDLVFAYQFVFNNAKCVQLKYNDEFLYAHDGGRNYPKFIYLMFNKSCEVVYENTAHYVYTD